MTIEVEVEVTAFTDKALQVLDASGDPVWIPKSQIQDYCGIDENNPESIFITQWLADEKGLI